MLGIAQGAAAQLGPAALKQCSPTSPGLPALLGAPQGELRLGSTAKGRSCDRFCSCPLRRRAAQGVTGKGRALSEPRRGELRSPPLRPSSAEHPAQPGDAAGALSSWVLLLGKTRRSTSPVNGETQPFRGDNAGNCPGSESQRDPQPVVARLDFGEARCEFGPRQAEVGAGQFG